MARLRQMAHETPDELPRHLVVRTLEDFRTMLAAHFRFEEESGYLPEIATGRPLLLERARRLVAQHGDFVTDLDRLVASAGSLPHLEDACQQVLGFLEMLAAHEQAETELVGEAALSDDTW